MIAIPSNHLWQSTLFAFAAALLTVLFRKNRAEVRYWLWFTASMKFFVPFSLLMSLGSHVQWTPPASLSTPALQFTVEMSQPFVDALPLPVSTPASHTDWKPALLLAVWAFGLAAVTAMRLRAWRRVRRAVLASSQIEIPAPVEVRSAPGLLEPGVVGVWRPVMLLPAGIEKRLTPAQLQAVLAHELCHVRRLGNLTATIHMAVEALFWFHPLVWWLGARLVEERERACDEEVLRVCGEPREYAEGILNVCKLYMESPLACVSGVTGSDLRKRIEEIMTNRKSLRMTVAGKCALAAAGAVALSVPIMLGVLSMPSSRAQTRPSGTPKFEVAAIKPCKDGEVISGGKSSVKSGERKGGGGGVQSSPGRLHMGCNTVEALVRIAYVLNASGSMIRDPSAPPVEGGPNWVRSDLYQIDAKAEGAPSDGLMMGPMMQTLLEDRFHLKIHRETREVPVYALTVAKGGSKLKPFQEGSCIPRDVPFRPPSPEEQQKKSCRDILKGGSPNIGMEMPGVTLDSFTRFLYIVMDRPVIDKTGLTGRYEIYIEFARVGGTPAWHPVGGPPPPPTPPSESPDENAAPSIFTVMEKELGLKLEPSKGPRDFFVIDSVERPSGN